MSESVSVRDLILSCTGLVTGLALGIVWKRRPHFPRDDPVNDVNYEDEFSMSQEPHKLVLCVRTDLKMQKGKIAAQVGHATLGAYKEAQRRHPQALRTWEGQAQPKIALQVPSRDQVTRLQNAAKRLNLTTYVVYDAGRTQVAAVRFE